MAEMLLWLLRGIPASQRQQLAGRESPSPAQKCKPDDTRVSGQLSLPTVEPGLWEAAFGLSHVPWAPCLSPSAKPGCASARWDPSEGRERDSDSTAPSPILCLSCEVTLTPGLSRVPVICPCRNQAPRCASLKNNHCQTKLPTHPGSMRQKSNAQSWGEIPEICTRVGSGTARTALGTGFRHLWVKGTQL